MNIALLAHDSKKELMVQFCIAYCGILSGHDLCAPTTTGKLISDATGLPVTLFLPCTRGGAQQIGARIAYNEIDLVLFFCDASGRESYKDIDSIARDYIYSNGYEGRFGHGLGHAVGIDIHESPRFSQTCNDIAQVGQVMTVEPGIYLPGVGGVRIENTCLVTETGCEPMSPKLDAYFMKDL